MWYEVLAQHNTQMVRAASGAAGLLCVEPSPLLGPGSAWRCFSWAPLGLSHQPGLGWAVMGVAGWADTTACEGSSWLRPSSRRGGGLAVPGTPRESCQAEHAAQRRTGRTTLSVLGHGLA